MFGRLMFGAMAVCGAAATVAGEIAAVTSWIPHAGTAGHPPSVEGYLALYALLVLTSVLALGAVGFAALTAVLEDW
jgi:hypothetical protein